MTIEFQHYNREQDYKRVSQFLIRHHQPGNADGNWLEPIWEYMHGHPYLDSSALGKIGLWQDGGEIAGVANYESRLGEAFLQIAPAYRHLLPEMLDYAERSLAGTTDEGEPELRVYVNDNDPEFLALVQARGYRQDPRRTRPMYRFDIPDLFPPIRLPQGFALKSIADECDWAKLHRVMWRGFDHPGEPVITDEELESRRKMFDTVTAHLDLKIVTAAPNGEFASICGMFYQPDHRFGYVEPVATDPQYRRMGLGAAAVLEGIRRCARLGATVAYVGSDQLFYQALGFRKVFDSQCWMKVY